VPSSRLIVCLAVSAAPLTASACALSGPRFEVTRWAPDQQGFGCPLEMVESKTQAKLQLRLSQSAVTAVPAGAAPTGGEDAVGYYTVTPEGALGVGPGQWLQVDCRTRRSLGVVEAGA
jgi:hypothetical protein